MSDVDLLADAIPHEWVCAKLGDIVETVDTGFPSGKHNTNKIGVPHLRPMNITSTGEIDLSNVIYVESSDYKTLIEGDVLFNNTNSPKLVGKTAFIGKNTDWAFSNHMTRIRVNPASLNSCYLAKYLHALYYTGFFRMRCTNHVNQASINRSFLMKNVVIPIPPLSEQHRIVAKIEELFTQLDAGVAALTMALAQLKRYRQSVLKAAFEGKLTEAWRKKHTDKKTVETVTQIIADNNHIQGLSSVPESWVWSNIGKISHLIQYGTSEKASEDPNGIPVLRMGNIQDGKLIFEGLKYLPNYFSDLEKYRLQDGDLLFNRTNSAELVGKSAVYNKKHPASVFASYLIRVRSNADLCHPNLLSYYINSPFGKIYIKSVVSQQVGQANVNGTKLANMPIPLPPMAEQREIVAEIERRFTIIDEMEKTIQQSLTQAERLRQSVLKQAFEGRLVPQDPNDEPASVLLERIKQENVAREVATRAQMRRKTKRSDKNNSTQYRLI